VENGRVILSNIVASQADLHAQYGGVFPEVASRQHIRVIYPVIQQALEKAHLKLKDIDAIAVTRGPGLPGALVMGLNAAKGLALGSGLPLIGVNHLEGHIYAAWQYQAGDEPSPEPLFPLLALIVSGGHTELLVKRSPVVRAVGDTLMMPPERFSTQARLLGLPIRGPALEHAALSGKPGRSPSSLPAAGDLIFFSGLWRCCARCVYEAEPVPPSKTWQPPGGTSGAGRENAAGGEGAWRQETGGRGCVANQALRKAR
jgi:N6-L-threonylcarbamoyladenine synthase